MLCALLLHSAHHHRTAHSVQNIHIHTHTHIYCFKNTTRSFWWWWCTSIHYTGTNVNANSSSAHLRFKFLIHLWLGFIIIIPRHPTILYRKKPTVLAHIHFMHTNSHISIWCVLRRFGMCEYDAICDCVVLVRGRTNKHNVENLIK